MSLWDPMDEDSFGKVCRRVRAELDAPLATALGIDTEKKPISCVASSSFQLRKSVDIDLAFRLLRKLSVAARSD